VIGVLRNIGIWEKQREVEGRRLTWCWLAPFFVIMGRLDENKITSGLCRKSQNIIISAF
jgi:hypothetical protein